MDRGEQKVVELVNEWAAYSETHPGAALADFCLHYLTKQVQPAHTADEATNRLIGKVATVGEEQWLMSLTEKAEPVVSITPEGRLSALVGRLSKFAYLYSKKAMQPLDFRSIEEPVYLIALTQMGTPKKSELIYEMMAEFASGIDVVNRLIKMGLIDEFPDEQDRRSKRLRITEKGVAVMSEAFPMMNRVANVAFGMLSDGEKAMLVQILDKLDRYHAEHYRAVKNADFDEVYERMGVAGTQ